MTVFEQHTHEQLQRASQHICDLTLRDLFAMSALNGMYANNTFFSNTSYREITEIAYRQADEMLKARKEKQGE